MHADSQPSPRDVYAELMKAAFGPRSSWCWSSRLERQVRAAVGPLLGASRLSEVGVQQLTPAGGDKWWRIVRGVDSGPVLDADGSRCSELSAPRSWINPADGHEQKEAAAQ
jgi:hypothetical protein